MLFSRPIRMILLISLVLFSTSTTVHAQRHNHGFVKFCNEGDTDLMFNLVSREGMGILKDSWRSHGRYPVGRRSCQFFAEDVSVALQMYVGIRRVERSGVNKDVFFDVSKSGSEVRRVDEKFCTKRESFDRSTTLIGHTQCPPGYSLQPFRIAIVLPTLIKYTLTVADSGGGATEQPESAPNPSGQTVQQAQSERDKRYVAYDEDKKNVEAMRAAERDAAARWKEADIAFNIAYKAWIHDSYDKAGACRKIKDSAVMTQCWNEHMESVKFMGSGCAGGRDLPEKERCFNKAIRDLDATYVKWSGDDSRATEPFSFGELISPKEGKVVKEPRPSVQVAPTIQAQEKPRNEITPNKPETAQREPAPGNSDKPNGVAATPPVQSQAKTDLSSLRLNYPKHANNLSIGRHELVQVTGASGFAYGYGVYMRGIGHCPKLKKSSIPTSRIYAIVEKKFWLDIVGLDVKVTSIEEAFAPVVLTTQWWTYVSSGSVDVEKIISKYRCNGTVTRNVVAAAEKLTENLLTTDIGVGGVKAYKRPASLGGLPEETQKLYDEYYFCKVRTGQTNHLGSFGPCDAALYEFQVSEAKATGRPAPAKEIVNPWRSKKGPLGEYKDRTFSVDVIFRDAPDHFTPEIPDDRNRLKYLNIKLEYNRDKRNKLWRIGLRSTAPRGVYGYSYTRFQGSARSIVEQDNRIIGKDRNDVVLVCEYANDGRTVNEVIYWFEYRPELADPERLSSRMRNHPLLLVQGVSAECPATLTQETLQRRQMLFDRM